MASFGKVLDLFNGGYFQLQDVIGNVEPLPSLVPYEEYMQNVIVYRMDTNHDIFMALIQDFTERLAHTTGKELWTWYVQWEVDETAPSPPIALPHSPKKPRLSIGQPNTPSNGPRYIAERRVIAAELMREEDMLRILLDIVQVESTIVPNFIEFLYRWIDFYEGDGKALKAALRGEIPSLWDFEYHPLVLPVDVKEAAAKAKAEAAANGATRDGQSHEASDKTPQHSGAEDLAQGSPTKRMREKPDLAAMEAQVEESERLQYREVHYGIQPPKLKEPLPPLINIPQDKEKRDKYYAACFKSRQRAYYLLIDAGVTVAQMRNYKRTQEAHPRDTPQHAGGDGLKYYENDAQKAQPILIEKEKQRQLRNKQMEIAISNKLAMEAQLAARSATPEGSSGVPLIPLTPLYAHRPSMSSDLLRRIQASRVSKAEEHINIVPTPLVGKMKSKLFEGAKDRNSLFGMFGPGEAQPVPRHTAGTDDGDGEDTDSDSDSEFGSNYDTDDQRRMHSTAPLSNITATLPPLPSLPRPSLPTPSQAPDSTAQPPQSPYQDSTLFRPRQSVPDPAGMPTVGTGTAIPNMVEYMRNLTPQQAGSLVPIMNTSIRQAIENSIQAPTAGPASQAPMPSAQFANPLLSAVHMTPAPANPLIGLGQAPRPSLPSLPPPGGPAITLSPPQPPTGQFQPPRGFERDLNYRPSGMPPGFQLPPSPAPMPGQRLQQGGPHMLGGQSGSGLHLARPGIGLAQQAPTQQFNTPAQPLSAPYPAAPGLSAPPPPPAFAQRLLAAQRAQTPAQGLQNDGPSTGDIPAAHGAAQFPYGPPPVYQPYGPPPPTSPNPFLNPPGPSMQRNAPSPLKLAPPSSPFLSLAPSIMATSPFAPSAKGIPIQIYFPNILRPANSIGPGGLKLGNPIKQTGNVVETDAFLLGWSIPESGKIVISRAIFLPAGVWKNALERVRKEKYEALETYMGLNAGANWNDPQRRVPHLASYNKLSQAFALMQTDKWEREQELTKRWRVSRGPMTATDRGAVWEGWAVTIDRPIEMSKEERDGAFILNGIIDLGETEVDRIKERRRKEMDELLAENEAMSSDEDVDMAD